MSESAPASAAAAPAVSAETQANTAGSSDAQTSSSSGQLVLHHLNDSRSQRILWLLEEFGVPYTIETHKRVNGRAPKELEKIHPLGKSPVITDKGKVIAESGNIIDYIIQTYGNGRAIAASDDGKREDVFWSHFAEGSCMNWLVMKLIFTVVPQRAPFFLRPLLGPVFGGVAKQLVDPEISKLGLFIGDELKKKNGNWLAGGDSEGNPTAADYQMMFVVEAMAIGGRLQEPSPEIVAYVKKIHSRPAWQRGIEKGGKYAYGKL